MSIALIYRPLNFCLLIQHTRPCYVVGHRWLVVGSSLIWKKKKLAEMVTRYHSLSLVVPLVVIRCHSMSLVVICCTTHCHSLYHSLSFVVPLVIIRCHSLYHSSLLVVTRCTTRLSFYKRSRYSSA